MFFSLLNLPTPLNTPDIKTITTLGSLKAAGYQSKSVKEELRFNLIRKLKNRDRVFDGIIGYDNTVIPDVERAILSRHNIILLGLRGQAKTRLARLMVHLLDEYIPVVTGSELNDDPLHPISRYAKDLIAEMGNNTPIEWLHRNERYTEKLATPDVTVADLIGDVDPIKAANLRLPYSDERVIHFGLVPRSHRGIFVINELPDLQARIQVSLFNILQEGDIQIRGFKVRMPLDIQFVFTANPEDYTNRGSIVTPLKDRIESQILTHYPPSVETSRAITEQEAHLTPEQQKGVKFNDLAKDLIEQIAFEARKSELVDSKSGVSARLTISAMENLASAAERRMLINNEQSTHVRVGDFWGVIPSITGKIELVYEGEQEGPFIVAQNLIGKAIRTLFTRYFPNPDEGKRKKQRSMYQPIIDWFSQGQDMNLYNDLSNNHYARTLSSIAGLADLTEKYYPQVSASEKLFLMEFVLHGLAEFSLLGKSPVQAGFAFKDLLNSMFNMDSASQQEEDEY
ncbi:magnesium chelatase [Sphingobacteriales bacterium UPWRP_1]|nr:magnesium chelatase [Sphingobacteriales bacterium TSM_CSS]PSJ73661.1 magnesium chelatase [Sphingobacteriales bacterium UPWRP_1]